MLFNGKLNIFENFHVDYNLPKYNKKNTGETSILTFDDQKSDFDERDSNNSVEPSSRIFFDGSMNMITTAPANPQYYNNNFFKRCYYFIKNIYTKNKKKYNSISVERVFAEVAKNSEELDIVKKRLEGYKKILAKAKTLGQKALEEQVKDKIKLFYLETILLKAEVKKYLTEEKLVMFANKCERGLRLDWVKNFTRIIPDDVMEKKIKMDELKVFDNYVILHFDPQNKGNSLTKEEIEKKKDPILFGVINGSTKLYFVGDWIDEICDLTWEKIAEILGDDVLENDVIKENVEEIKDL